MDTAKTSNNVRLGTYWSQSQQQQTNSEQKNEVYECGGDFIGYSSHWLVEESPWTSVFQHCRLASCQRGRILIYPIIIEGYYRHSWGLRHRWEIILSYITSWEKSLFQIMGYPSFCLLMLNVHSNTYWWRHRNKWSYIPKVKRITNAKSSN